MSFWSNPVGTVKNFGGDVRNLVEDPKGQIEGGADYYGGQITEGTNYYGNKWGFGSNWAKPTEDWWGRPWHDAKQGWTDTRDQLLGGQQVPMPAVNTAGLPGANPYLFGGGGLMMAGLGKDKGDGTKTLMAPAGYIGNMAEYQTGRGLIRI